VARQPHVGRRSHRRRSAKLGYKVDSRTVAKYRPAGLSRGRGQRWATFIRNHLQETWACDFFVLVTARFRVLYVFVVLSLGRRRIIHIAVTEHPTAAWIAQRLVEAVADSEQVPRFLIHDRDAVYGADFRRRVRGLGARALLTPPRPLSGTLIAAKRIVGGLHHSYGFADPCPPPNAGCAP